MVKRRNYVIVCAALAMMVALSACSSAADEPTGDTEKVDTEVSSELVNKRLMKVQAKQQQVQ